MSNLPTLMRAVYLTGHGGTDKLEIRDDATVPTPSAREVLVKVAAAGINNTDVNTRIAWYSKSDGAREDASWAGAALELPRIQGADVCGEIVAVGSSVSKERIGERVLIEPCIRELKGRELTHPGYFGSECHGGFAEYTTVASRHAYKVTSQYSDAELASFPCSYSTAENMLTKASVTENEIVVVTGASGGVGSAAVQLAKARGAQVIAIAEMDKEDSLLQMGADRVIDRFSPDLATAIGVNSVDAIIDMIAGEQFPEYLQMLKIHGRYAVCGAIAGPHVDLDIRDLYLKDLSLFGCTVLKPEVFGNLIRHINQGHVAPVVAMEYPLEKIREAQDVFMERKHLGKMVLTIQ